ncbi:hypothetical protein [Myxococcus sp. CA039A]|uniref:hypothetical protein n=1 Tax=Myxococcus sp. CA039A TaxID=2741737 RepID=UPI00157A2F4E|nr:hypothetical protein [Myxococcus sp. CA039A]NTX58255.1 hypothetical protein [Myxococcus sp. CA039A]
MSVEGGDLGDADFLAAVEAATYPGERFRHREHLRLAWLCLRAEGFEAGLARLRDLIRRYATTLGAAGKYHETLTRGWAELVQGAMEASPGSASLEALLETTPELADAKLLASHYQKETLDSAEARASWVAPDLKPLRAGAALRGIGGSALR